VTSADSASGVRRHGARQTGDRADPGELLGEQLSQVRDMFRQQAVGTAEIAKETGLTRQCRVTSRLPWLMGTMVRLLREVAEKPEGRNEPPAFGDTVVCCDDFKSANERCSCGLDLREFPSR
jgi:hypothetical protein